jgi:hypothetical protein
MHYLLVEGFSVVVVLLYGELCLVCCRGGHQEQYSVLVFSILFSFSLAANANTTYFNLKHTSELFDFNLKYPAPQTPNTVPASLARQSCTRYDVSFVSVTC